MAPRASGSNRGEKGYTAAGTFLAKRRRATSAAAAPPNSSTIGGAGTGCGGLPLDPGG